MPASSAPTLIATHAGSLRAEQLYATHCLKSDSVEGQAGFSVRAASAQSSAWVRFARDFPSLKVPLDMTGTELFPTQAPRRLALVKAPEGKMALIHSSYLPKDTLGRSLNYFTHVLIYDRIPARLALRAWGATTWTTTYPEGAPQGLEPFAGVPDGGVVNDEALALFLSDPAAPVNQDLATLLYPARAQGDVDRHRRWVRAVLQGFLLARSQGGSARSRLYILAEPGLVALLCYAVARLLPDSLTEACTFSTFESTHGSLREFQDAQVIGTYVSNTQRGLETDYLNRRGFGVDTFLNRFSPELSQEGPHPLDTLIAKAARREWAEIDELHALWRFAEPSLAGLEDVLRIQGLVSRLRAAANWEIADLLALQATTAGRGLLQGPEFRDKLWPQVRKWSSRRDVTQAFAALFRDPAHLADLLSDARNALESGTLPDWQQRWEVIKSVLPAHEVAAQFADLLNAVARGRGTSFPLQVRIALLREWQALEPHRDELPAESAWLLDCVGARDWQELGQAKLPARWVGQALCRRCAGDGPDDADAVQYLQQGDDSLTRGFCQALGTFPDHDKALTHLLGPQQKAAPDLFQRLWKSGLRFDEPTLDALLVRVEADSMAWYPSWKIDDQFVVVLKHTTPGGPFAQRLWKRFTDRLTLARLFGDESQQKLLVMLQGAAAALQQRVPPEAATIVRDWTLLARHLTDPGETTPDELLACCKRRGIDSRETLLAAQLSALIQSPANKPVPVAKLAPLFKSARRSYTTDHEALEGWLKVVEKSAPPAEQVSHYQAEFIHAALDPKQWPRLAAVFKNSLRPKVLAIMRESVPAPSPTIALQTTGPAVTSRQKLGGKAKPVNAAIIAATVALAIAFLAMSIVWWRANEEKSRALARLEDTEKNRQKDQNSWVSKLDLDQANDALKTETDKANELSGQLEKARREKGAAEKRAADTKKQLVALQTQRNGSTNSAVAPPTPAVAPPTPAVAPPTPAVAPPTPAVAPPTPATDLYRHYIALANLELLSGNIPGIKKVLSTFDEEEKKQPQDSAVEPRWELETLRRFAETITPRNFNTESINDMAFIQHLNGQSLVWASNNKVQWIDLKEGAEARKDADAKVPNKGGAGRVESVESGDTFALMSKGGFSLRSSKDKDFTFLFEIKPKEYEFQQSQFALSSTGSRRFAVVAVNKIKRKIQIWKDDNLGEETEPFEGEVSALAFSRDGNQLAWGMKNGTVMVWPGGQGRVRSVKHTHVKVSVTSLAFNSDGGKIAIGGTGGAEVCFLDGEIKPWLLTSGTSQNRCVAFSAKRDLLATSGEGTTVRLWDAKTGHSLLTLPHDKPVWKLKFDPHGNWLAVVQGRDKVAVIKLWDLSAPAP